MINLKDEFFANHRIESDFHWKVGHDEFWSATACKYAKYMSEKSDLKIPKKIHQIWIGKKIPKQYERWCLEWKKFNPDYEYKLWSESDILDLGLVNEKLFIETNNVGIKSDIARYEILNRLGGIYLDTDMQLIKPFDNFLHQANFISCINSSYVPVVFNGFIASSSSSIILTNIISSISNKKNDSQQTGVATLKFSGPLLLTDILMQYIDRDDFVLLPSQYFYPLPNWLRLTKANINSFTTNNTYAVHHWEVSWCKPKISQIIINKTKNYIRNLRNLFLN